MSEQPGTRPPDGQDEPRTVELGEPEQQAEGARSDRSDERPDLDARQRRMSEQRKPMGPPQEEEPEGSDESTGRRDDQQSDNPPTDPA